MADNPNVGGGKIRPRRAPSRKPYSRTQNKSFFSKVSDSFKYILNPITPRWLVNLRGNEEQPQSSAQLNDQGAGGSSAFQNSESLNNTNNNMKASQLSRPALRNYQVSASSSQYSTATYDVSEETLPKQLPVNKETGKEGLLKHLSMASKRARMETDSPSPSDSSFLRSEMKLLNTNDNTSVASSECSSVRVGSQKTDLSDNESIGKQFWNSRDSISSQSRSRQQATMSSSKKPRFNPSIFGMPALGASSPEPHQSSFYEGSVQFGGANASGRSPYFATPYKIPSVTKVKVRHVHHQRPAAKTTSIPMRNASLPLDESMSSTARRILLTLEKMSSPLNDARKIPTISRTPSSYAAGRSRRRTLETSSLLQTSTAAPPITGLSSPSSAKLRRRTQLPVGNSLLIRNSMEKPLSHSQSETIATKKMESTNSMSTLIPDSRVIAARGLPAPIASLSSSMEMVRPDTKSPFTTPNSSGGGGKMKSGKKSSTHYTSMRNPDDEEPEQPQLPDVTLPISSLPSFNFAAKGMTSTPAVTPVAALNRIKAVDKPKFSFASPIAKTPQTEEHSASDTPKFQFSSPASKGPDVEETPKSTSCKTFNAGTKTGNSNLMFAPDPKVVSAVKNTKRRSSPFSTPVTSPSKPVDSLKKGSVMDILGGKETKENEAVAEKKPLPPLKASTSGWACEICMLRNDESTNSCVACTTPKPSSVSKPSLPKALPIQSNKGWDCPTCLVPNDASRDTCEACEMPKPGSSSSKGGFKATEFSEKKSSFSFGLPSKNRETSEKKDSTVKFGFKASSTDQTSSTSIKFGAPVTKSTNESSQSSSKKSGWGDLGKKASGTWECEVCMVPNSNDRRSCESCDSPKPGTKAIFNASFKFGESSSGLAKFSAPASEKGSAPVETIKQSESQSSPAAVASKPKESAEPSFSFGAPKAIGGQSSKAVKIPSFGSDTTKVDLSTEFTFGQKKDDVSLQKKEPVKLPAFGVPSKDNSASPQLPPLSQPADSPSQRLAMFGTGAGSLTTASTKSMLSAPSPPASNPAAGFGSLNTATKSVPVPAFGTSGSSSTLKPSGPVGFRESSQVQRSDVNKEAPPAYSIGVKPTDPETKPVEVKDAPPTFSFGVNKPVFAGFGSGEGKSKTDNVSSTTLGFGNSGAKPTDVKAASPFGTAAGKAPVFTGFGTSSGSAQATKNESSKPFGGFDKPTPLVPSKPVAAKAPVFAGFGTSSGSTQATKNELSKPFSGFDKPTPPAPSKPAGGVSSIFNSASKSALAPFGATTSVAPALGSASNLPPASVFGSGSNASSTSVFGSGSNASSALAFGSGGNNASGFGSTSNNASSNPFGSGGFGGSGSSSAFGNPATTNVFVGASGEKKSVFGQQSSDTSASLPKPNLQFGSGTGNTNTNTGGFQFGASNSSQPGGNFQFGSGNQQPASSVSSVNFNFGGNSSTPNNPAPTAVPSGGFSFGGSSSGQSNEVFKFGAGNSQPTNENKVPNFGGANASSSAGFNFGQSTTPSFNFGAGQQGSTMGGGVPAFNAAPPRNPFEQQPGQRRIKTARRKLRK